MGKTISINELQKELNEVTRKMSECVTESGVVINGMRYEYHGYISEAKEIRNLIDKIVAKTSDKIIYR